MSTAFASQSSPHQMQIPSTQHAKAAAAPAAMPSSLFCICVLVILLVQMSLRTYSAAHFAKLCPSGCFSAPPPVVVANRPAEPGRRQSWTAPHDTSNTRSTLQDALGPPLVAVANQTSIAWKEAAWDCAIRHLCIIFPPHRHTTANAKSGQGRLLL